MARYYSIKIDDFWLTKDGTDVAAGAGRCALGVEGVFRLQSDYLKTQFLDFRGNPIIQKTNVGTAGRPIVISKPDNLNEWKIPVSVAEDIIALHRASEASDTAIRLVGSDGDTPDFDLWVLPAVDAFEFKNYQSGHYINPILRYVTVGDTELFWDGDQLLWDTDVLLWS